MQCPRCRHENPERANFCLECGARLALPCGECGTELPASAKFCLKCGQPAAAPRAATVSPELATRFPSPHVYTPQHLAERIISSRAALEGERKQVTVLFADLKGSMELLADRDPEDARRILDPVLAHMMDAVHRYEGTVNQVMGDGIMALFGAPLAHEDHAVRACYAALHMQQAVKQYAEQTRRIEGITPQIRVGLNSGEVVVRSIGNDLRMDYTAVGPTAHVAARMEQVAIPGSVLLAPSTLELVEGYVQVAALGPVPVKGLSEPVIVYDLLGAGIARSRLQAAAARGFSKFVGRDTEIDTLRRTLEQAGSGQGQLVALVGEAGVGKSRLAWEFGHSHRTQGWLVLESGSVSYGRATSYLPVIDLLKSYCGIEDRDDARRIREKITGKLLTLDPALQPTLPAFFALLDVSIEDPAWQALDPPQRRQRTLNALKRLLLRESQEQPLLLVFEDLHWVDTETQALLDSLVESLPTARILLLVNYRPEHEHSWHRKTYYWQLRLDPLAPESADELLAALLGDAAELQPLKRTLVERTQGNPFFVEESVRTLVESGVLTGQRGAYRLARPFESTHVPATVQAVLAARIDRLAPEDKRLLQAAAVIGKDVPYALVCAISELPESVVREALARLQAAEFLYETSIFPDLEYTFKHALTLEVAYGSLLQERRRAIHAQIVEAIEGLYQDRLAEQIERLARHALRGGVWHKALAYLRQAGTRAAARSAHREALVYWEQALDALAQVPLSRAVQEQAVDIRFAMRASLWSLGQIDRMLDDIQEARRLAEALGDPLRLGRALAHQTNNAWVIGDYASAVVSGEQALAVALARGDFALQVEARFRLGIVFHALGDYAPAINLLGWVRDALRGDALHERFGLAGVASSLARTWLAWCYAERGEFADGLRMGNEAVRIAESLNHPFSLFLAYSGLGGLYLQQGQAEKALPLLERGRELCHDADLQVFFPWAASDLGAAYGLSGRVTEAIPLLERAVAEAAGMHLMVLQAQRLTRLARAYLLAGRGAAAEATAARALTFAREHQERGHEAGALQVLGQIAAQAASIERAAPDVERAEDYYRQALALAELLGMRPLVAHARRGLGALYQRSGRDEPAHAELMAAAEMYRAMEMTLWIEHAEVAYPVVAAR